MKTMVIKLDKDLSNSLYLVDIRLTAYQNLFSSFLEKRIEEYDKFNLESFLEKYSVLHIDKELLVKKIFELLPDNTKKEIGDKYSYNIDFLTSTMTISYQ